MKKLILTVLLAIATAVVACAQTGAMGAGINLGVAPSLESNMKVTNFQLGAKFQYGITDDFRAEADVEYGFKSKGLSVFDITANVHYLVKVADRIKIYPLAGLGWASLKQDFGGLSFDDYLKEAGMTGAWNQLPSYVQQQMRDEFNKQTGAAGSESVSRFVFNIGVGGEYDLTDNLALNLEVKYQYMKDFNRMPITLGIAYKF